MKLTIRQARFAIALVIFILSGVSRADQILYVAQNGDDSWSGRSDTPASNGRDGPCRTFEGIKARLRAMRRSTGISYPVTIYVRAGVYRFSQAFVFESEDAGTATESLTLCNYPDEVVYLRGSVPLTGWGPLTDSIAIQNIPLVARPFVKQATLPSSVLPNLGTWGPRGIPNMGLDSPAELYDFRRPARLAQYPNRTAPYATTTSQGPGFVSSAGLSERMQNWTYLPDAFVHGYLGVDWSDCQIRVKGIDPALGRLDLDTQSYYGYKQNARFRVKNVLAELDQPGEYYLDRDRGLIFYYPVKKDGSIDAELTQLAAPLISVIWAPNLTIQGLIFEQSRHNALEVIDAPGMKLLGCTIRNMGASAAYVRSSDFTIQSCDIYNIAGAALTITAGNRQTLSSGNAQVKNCHFFNIGMTDYCFSPGLKMEGVGSTISGNSFHDSKHIALYFDGNEHMILNNSFTDCVTETLDAGAVYAGRDWTARGNVISNNTFKNIYDRLPGSANALYHSEVWSVYLDDCQSGTDVIGNLFTRVSSALQIGGGRENRFENNIIYNEGFSAPNVDPGLPNGFHIDSKLLTPGWDSTWNTLNQRLVAVPFNQAPFSVRYPRLPSILEDEPRSAKYNSVKRNIYVGPLSSSFDIDWAWFTHNDEVTWDMMGMQDNVFGTQDPGFINAPRGDFRLSPTCTASRIGFVPINLKRVGLSVDDYRTGMLIHAGY